MYELEGAVESIPEFQNIAFFHHIILTVAALTDHNASGDINNASVQ